MKKYILLFIFTLYFLEPGEFYCQTKLQNYIMKKKISIPIGLGNGKINVEYFVLGRYVDVPNVSIVDNEGNFIIGSRLQKETLQKFDNNGIFLSVLSMCGPNNRNVNYPYKLATDSNNAIYVLDVEKYLSNNLFSSDYAIKKFNSEGEFIYKLDYKNIRGDVTEQDRIDELWVTPGGEVYIKDWYNSKTAREIWGGAKTERTIFGIDKNGKFEGKVSDRFYENYKGETIKIGIKQENHNFNYTISNYTTLNQKIKVKKLIMSEAQLKLDKSGTLIFENVEEPEFLGFDKLNNIYFGQRGSYQQTGIEQVPIPYSAVYKYSPENVLLAKIEFQQGGKYLIDSEGNVYLIYTVYTTPKRFTEGDHIEIQKWIQQNY